MSSRFIPRSHTLRPPHLTPLAGTSEHLAISKPRTPACVPLPLSRCNLPPMPPFAHSFSPSPSPPLLLSRRNLNTIGIPALPRLLAPVDVPPTPRALLLEPLPPRGRVAVALAAARKGSSVPESGGGGAVAAKKHGEIYRVVELGLLFGLWYLSNVYFNIYNKQILKAFMYPFTMSAYQFVFGSIFAIVMWAVGVYKRPNISMSMLLAILPLAVVHAVGNMFTNISLLKVSVSFTHTIKAMEPFFTVLLSVMFLGEMPSLLVLSSLIPVVGGVVLASLTEASFNWYGFWSAMGSNLSNQSRNVLSKKLMTREEESVDNITMYSIITIMSLILSTPIAFLAEGIKFTPTYLQSLGLNVQDIYVKALLAGIFFHAHQQISYMILEKVSPVTHSVGNCVKRVVVIVSSVLFFRTPVSLVNALGTGVALLGVFLYSRAKKIKGKEA